MSIEEEIRLEAGIIQHGGYKKGGTCLLMKSSTLISTSANDVVKGYSTYALTE
jgi:hypothetical protein